MDRQFLSRLEQLFSEHYADVKDSFDLNRLASVRVNTLVINEEQGVAGLDRLGFEPQQVLAGKNGYVLRKRTKRELTETEEYKAGWYYIQSLSSMVPVWSIEEEIRGE